MYIVCRVLNSHGKLAYRSELLLKEKLHQEHSSRNDTFTFVFLDMSAYLERDVL